MIKARPLSVAMIGTRGVPARYGGFETCIEEVGRRLVDRGLSVTVYCRNTGAGEGRDDPHRPKDYLGMKLVYLPAPMIKGLETLVHTSLSVVHARGRGFDALLLFNIANAPTLLLLGKKGVRHTALHVDGLEWQRSKWGRFAKFYLHRAEGVAVRKEVRLIADAQGIADYYRARHRRDSTLIHYGAPMLRRDDFDSHRIMSLDLIPHGYHLVVARLEPENNVHMILDGYTRSRAEHRLIVVGDAPYGADYVARLRQSVDARVSFLGSVWDQRLLNSLYAHSLSYLHGHSVGGTNPSLLRAVGAGAPVIAHDNVFNREVLGDNGKYFSAPADLAPLIEETEAESERALVRGRIAQEDVTMRYDWERVADQYQCLCTELALV